MHAPVHAAHHAAPLVPPPPRPGPAQVPIGLEEFHEGVVDIVRRVALSFGGPKGTEVAEGPVPAELADEVEARRSELIERVSEVRTRCSASRGAPGAAAAVARAVCVRAAVALHPCTSTMRGCCACTACAPCMRGPSPASMRGCCVHAAPRAPLHAAAAAAHRRTARRLTTRWLSCSWQRSRSRRARWRPPSGARRSPTGSAPSSWAARTKTRVRAPRPLAALARVAHGRAARAHVWAALSAA